MYRIMHYSRPQWPELIARKQKVKRMHTESWCNLNVDSVLNVEVTWTSSDSRPNRRVVILPTVTRIAAVLLTLKHRRCGLGNRASIPDRGNRTSHAEVRNERSYASTPAWLQCVHWGRLPLPLYSVHMKGEYGGRVCISSEYQNEPLAGRILVVGRRHVCIFNDKL